ncbi:flagellin [Paracoccus sp. 1_MG-2023]|uniref:flagellin n=1 Tax=unclassified Paracoccus (in: a-proteobacteria) TaxID=2688777 RepID=UPI001C088FF9|nr:MULTISPECIES: flagellin [unclassified Paracoccus (in: a-proteobacteria)]MBU2956883.1 hypothetical protein [Paracoccus sp. C2R09]MDO6668081.1 flagellin [Paracoccus sp. 1_MG-2023]
MTVTGTGDQARAYALQLSSNRLKSTLNTLTREVASGEVADLGQRVQGNTRTLNDIETRLSQTRQLQQNGSEAANQLEGLQNIFEALRLTTGTLAVELVSDPLLQGGFSLQTRITQGATAFETVVQQLNGMNAGRFQLSGTATDQRSLPSSAQMLDQLQTAIGGATDAAQIEAAVSAWFDDPAGGFMTSYGGNQQPRTIPVSEGTEIAITTTAADPGIRDMLKGLAMVALMDRGVLAGDQAGQKAMIQAGGQAMLTADGAILAEMGRIGLQQEVVERASTINGAAIATFEIARSDIRGADAFETAAALTEVESQLEALYAVTARLSKLSLVDYL